MAAHSIVNGVWGESVMAKNVLVTIWERNTKETQCRLSDDQT
ncbi:hypothetical protein SAMN03159429_01370, partial [Pseudomonas sp. NFACC51]